jgi:chemotaxis protein methyltransferase CheR
LSDPDCTRFLQWALPRLRLRWAGFRKPRRQVCRRIRRRRQELGLPDLDAYRAYLEAHREEWAVLDGLCRVTISRFARDREVFAFLERRVLPELARAAAAETLAAWSAGCASGEEPYSLALAWELEVAPSLPGVALEILATDADPALLERARAARYDAGSLRDLPPERRAAAFERDGDRLRLRPELARRVTFAQHDLRSAAPGGPFDLILCRNMAFTYFDRALQEETCAKLAAALRPGGALVVGGQEELPPGAAADFSPWPGGRAVHRRLAAGAG